jgi:hypothetical protein
MASSSIQGKFVAASSKTLQLSFKIELNWTNSSVLNLREASFSLSDRQQATESISSMKIMQGCLCLAKRKRDFSIFSDSPKYFASRSLAQA